MPKLLKISQVLAAALVAQTLVGCGLRTDHDDHRTDRAHAQIASGDASAAPTPNAQGPSSADTQEIAAPSTGDASTSVMTTAPADAAPVSQTLNRAFRSFFYQSAVSLADLFATPGAGSSSMLCFPSALAYQSEYRRTKAEAPASALIDGTDKPATDNAIGAKDVRWIADFCKADLKKGMTIPQGVACIDKMFADSHLSVEIRVIGQDAQWAAYDMYPASTHAELRTVTPGDVHKLIKSDASVIALIGAYVKDGAKLKRVKGHFISLTGYSRSAQTPADQALIGIVDPSADYSRRADGVAADNFVMAPRSAELASQLPANAGYELRGFSLGVEGAVVIVESVIAFH